MPLAGEPGEPGEGGLEGLEIGGRSPPGASHWDRGAAPAGNGGPGAAALPRAFHLPVELAIRAVERVLDLGLGLDR